MRLLLDTAAGVRHLHEATPRCIHRDLKCQNLLLGSGMELKVADFGLSRECFATAAMTRVGSVQWAAPEVLLGKKYSHKCDLWALGVVCWEILTARVPFEGMGPGAIATAYLLGTDSLAALQQQPLASVDDCKACLLLPGCAVSVAIVADVAVGLLACVLCGYLAWMGLKARKALSTSAGMV